MIYKVLVLLSMVATATASDGCYDVSTHVCDCTGVEGDCTGATEMWVPAGSPQECTSGAGCSGGGGGDDDDEDSTPSCVSSDCGGFPDSCDELEDCVGDCSAEEIASIIADTPLADCDTSHFGHDHDDDDDPCFPSSAMVTKADGSLVRIDSLKEGDKIVAAHADGALTTDTVSLLSIAKPEAQADFLSLSTAANATLTLTTEHHVPVGAECCSTLKKAKDVKVGDKVYAVVAGKAVATTVTATSKAHAQGLHSPVLTHGGFPVVDGLVTSFDSIDKVRLATYGLAPLLAACKASGTCDKFKEMFLADDRKYVEALQRRRLFGGATFTGGINLQDGYRGRRL